MTTRKISKFSCLYVPWLLLAIDRKSKNSQAIDCMSTWPLISRNKVEDSKVCAPIERCTESDNVVLKKAAEDVCTSSSSLWLV